MTEAELQDIGAAALQFVKALRDTKMPPTHSVRALGIACRIMVIAATPDEEFTPEADERAVKALMKLFERGLRDAVLIEKSGAPLAFKSAHTIQ